MTENNNDNFQKQENYREQFKRLKKALSNSFNLEAIFIEYAIIEDRTESILRHANQWEAYIKHRKGREASIESKIKYIQKRAENKSDTLHKYFSDDLLDRVLEWKEERNRLIHALLKQQFAHNELHVLAVQGNELAKAVRTKTTSYNRAVKKERL